ncbi:MAG: AAA family ATPase, partial [Planctomycetota bacterium]
VVQTHISWVFLAGDLVYKVKKPVDYGFLDFSTLEKREYFCREEVRLNRRLCPDVYLDVVPVTVDPSGRARMGGRGRTVDFAVKMKRLPAEGMMLSRLERGLVGRGTIDALISVLVEFFSRADSDQRVRRYGALSIIRHYTDEDFWQTVDFVGPVLSGGRFDHIQKYNDNFLAERAEVFGRRLEGGFIREGHGDLHMGNICLGERIWIFDCIEFNEALRCHDVTSDLAFLAMDLDFHQRPDLGRRLVETYVECSGDEEIWTVLDFYKCYRAYVRGKINCYTADQAELPESEREEALRRARRYFDLAYLYAGGRRRPRILVFFGLMGSGKTHWAKVAGRKLHARVVSSDRMRKSLAGLHSTTRVYVPFGQGLYSEDMSARVYQAMHAEAEKLAGAGRDVILDGSYMKAAERRAVIELAERVGAELTFVHTTAAEESVLSRLENREARGHSVSDGRREIYLDQKSRFEPLDSLAPARVVTLDTTGPEAATAAGLWEALGI